MSIILAADQATVPTLQMKAGVDEQVDVLNEQTLYWTIREARCELATCCAESFRQIADALEDYPVITLDGEISARWRILMPDGKVYECESDKIGPSIELDHETHWGVNWVHRTIEIQNVPVRLNRPVRPDPIPFGNEFLSRRTTVFIDPKDGAFEHTLG